MRKTRPPLREAVLSLSSFLFCPLYRSRVVTVSLCNPLFSFRYFSVFVSNVCLFPFARRGRVARKSEGKARPSATLILRNEGRETSRRVRRSCCLVADVFLFFFPSFYADLQQRREARLRAPVRSNFQARHPAMIILTSPTSPTMTTFSCSYLQSSDGQAAGRLLGKHKTKRKNTTSRTLHLRCKTTKKERTAYATWQSRKVTITTK